VFPQLYFRQNHLGPLHSRVLIKYSGAKGHGAVLNQKGGKHGCQEIDLEDLFQLLSNDISTK
jgi:hypothetical protein